MCMYKKYIYNRGREGGGRVRMKEWRLKHDLNIMIEHFDINMSTEIKNNLLSPHTIRHYTFKSVNNILSNIKFCSTIVKYSGKTFLKVQTIKFLWTKSYKISSVTCIKFVIRGIIYIYM